MVTHQPHQGRDNGPGLSRTILGFRNRNITMADPQLYLRSESRCNARQSCPLAGLVFGRTGARLVIYMSTRDCKCAAVVHVDVDVGAALVLSHVVTMVLIPG